jgi:signal transduction histidine kinase
MEYPCHSASEKRWYRVTVNPLSESTNKGVVVMHINITDRMLTELERDRITGDLIQRNRDLEQFAYIVSHNLRAPVANILGITEMMNTFSLTVSEEDEMKSELIVSVKKLDGVIKDLNHILQVKREISEKREVVYLSEVLDDIKLSIRNLITKEKVEILSNFTKLTNIVTLKSYIYSIFYNLILNSIKYKQFDKPPVIKIESTIRDGKLVLEFEDNGIGIDLTKKGNQVFGLYKRFHLHQEGKGMGLYMVKTQVETLGGRISIQSEVNKGTKFTIEFDK